MKIQAWVFLVVAAAITWQSGIICADGADFRELDKLYEADRGLIAPAHLDRFVLSKVRAHRCEPAPLCSDAVFVRRIYLDMLGIIPTPEDLEAWEKDSSRDKRARLIEKLFDRPEFADYWTLKWCDILRVKAEFPVNLWPNAVQAYHRWIHYTIEANIPFNKFAYLLLTSSGSNFRQPAVNFYRAAQSQEPEDLARVAALTFMGSRIADWPEDKRKDLTNIFTRVAFKKSIEWKEEIVYLAHEPYAPLDIVLPDGAKVTVPAGEDPRIFFAKWLITPQNPWFTKAICNRAWSWFLGRGIIHEPDDIRGDNPPVNPELLAYLQKEFVKGGYDMRHLFRVILNSQTYQQSSIARDYSPKAGEVFAYYPVRRLKAEVLQDALNYIGGSGELYSSPIPEPFTWIPEYQRTVQLADGSITSQFLENFGRPSRDLGYESEREDDISTGQMRYLLNSADVINTIRGSSLLKRAYTASKGNVPDLTKNLYRLIISRDPTRAELDRVQSYFSKSGLSGEQCAEDIAWALINSREFVCAH